MARPNTPDLPASRRRAPLTLDGVLVRIAAEQLGLLTVAQAERAGIDRRRLHRRVESGLLVPLFVGVYRIVGVESSIRQTSLAACLAVSESAVWGLSAAMVHGLPVGVTELSKPSVVVAADRDISARGIQTHRTRHLPPTQRWLTGRITTVPATIVDLAGLVSADTLGRCLDHTIANRTATVAGVLKIARQRPTAGFRGRKALMNVLDARSDGHLLHRSGIERKVLRWMLAAGVPEPASNVVVEGVEVDFAWDAFRVALEVSPFFTHGSAVTQKRDAERRRILQPAGWRVIEAGDDHLAHARAFAPIIVDLRALLRPAA
jgi:Transcriptional regulator, AbiEi antitoxin